MEIRKLTAEDNYRDIYLSLCNKHSTPYVALKNGEPVGYLAATAFLVHLGLRINNKH